MRIMRRFTVPDLMRTAGARESNVLKYVTALARHGYVRKLTGFVSGRVGSRQAYMLIKNPGPNHPVYCEACGQNLGKPCAVPAHPWAHGISPSMDVI
jgi:hypothetical protein